MLERVGDLFSYPGEWVGIPTNGKRYYNSGYAVMGAGVALSAKNRYPGIDRVLGFLLHTKGNHVHLLGCWDNRLVFNIPTKEHHQDGSPIELIVQSCTELRELYLDCDHKPRQVLLPRLGCGHGRLEWEDVRPAISKVLLESAFILLEPGPTLTR